MSQREPLFFRLFKRHVSHDFRIRKPHVVEWICGTGAVVAMSQQRVAAMSVVKDHCGNRTCPLRVDYAFVA
jgi:hypothetical protein